jgi:hypothetical protein
VNSDDCTVSASRVSVSCHNVLYAVSKSTALLTLLLWSCATLTGDVQVGKLQLRRINELEVALLQALQYNVRVDSGSFAR